MIFGVALEVLRKQSNCWDKITECSANCEECECHVDASNLVEAVKTVLDYFPTQMSETSGRDISVTTNDLVSRSKIIEEAPPVLASTSQTKFKPGSKFLLEIGEKRIGLDEYSIVGTDLYVWGSLLEKLTPYEPVDDTISRQAAINALNVDGLTITGEASAKAVYNYIFMVIGKLKSMPSVQAKQKKGHWIPVDDPSITGRCSVCGFETHLMEDDVYGYDYCPNCGARLEVVDDE